LKTKAESVVCTPGKRKNFSQKPSKKKKKCERESENISKKKQSVKRVSKLSNFGLKKAWSNKAWIQKSNAWSIEIKKLLKKIKNEIKKTWKSWLKSHSKSGKSVRVKKPDIKSNKYEWRRKQ
jgi:hypothetical protein